MTGASGQWHVVRDGRRIDSHNTFATAAHRARVVGAKRLESQPAPECWIYYELDVDGVWRRVPVE